MWIWVCTGCSAVSISSKGLLPAVLPLLLLTISLFGDLRAARVEAAAQAHTGATPTPPGSEVTKELVTLRPLEGLAVMTPEIESGTVPEEEIETGRGAETGADVGAETGAGTGTVTPGATVRESTTEIAEIEMAEGTAALTIGTLLGTAAGERNVRPSGPERFKRPGMIIAASALAVPVAVPAATTAAQQAAAQALHADHLQQHSAAPAPVSVQVPAPVLPDDSKVQ